MQIGPLATGISGPRSRQQRHTILKPYKNLRAFHTPHLYNHISSRLQARSHTYQQLRGRERSQQRPNTHNHQNNKNHENDYRYSIHKTNVFIHLQRLFFNFAFFFNQFESYFSKFVYYIYITR